LSLLLSCPVFLIPHPWIDTNPISAVTSFAAIFWLCLQPECFFFAVAVVAVALAILPVALAILPAAIDDAATICCTTTIVIAILLFCIFAFAGPVAIELLSLPVVVAFVFAPIAAPAVCQQPTPPSLTFFNFLPI
jgi:hypothetical protein